MSWCIRAHRQATCGACWCGAHSAVCNPVGGCATMPTRQKDKRPQGRSRSLQAQRLGILTVCNGDNRRMGRQGSTPAAKQKLVTPTAAAAPKERPPCFARQGCSFASAWTGEAAGARVPPSATTRWRRSSRIYFRFEHPPSPL